MLDLSELDKVSRLLLKVPLRPIQGDRFQPTGFPSLGAASYQGWEYPDDEKPEKEDTDKSEKKKPRAVPKLLVESTQSMANRLETTCWDTAQNKPVEALSGISHVTVTRKVAFLTDSMLEAHRINSPYLLEGKDRKFFDNLKTELGGLEEGPINRKKLAEVLLKYDVGSLIHGVFLPRRIWLEDGFASRGPCPPSSKPLALPWQHRAASRTITSTPPVIPRAVLATCPSRGTSTSPSE
jgi:CRISPR-associated protein Csb1